jgi:hypothetical protein
VDSGKRDRHHPLGEVVELLETAWYPGLIINFTESKIDRWRNTVSPSRHQLQVSQRRIRRKQSPFSVSSVRFCFTVLYIVPKMPKLQLSDPFDGGVSRIATL